MIRRTIFCFVIIATFTSLSSAKEISIWGEISIGQNGLGSDITSKRPHWHYDEFKSFYKLDFKSNFLPEIGLGINLGKNLVLLFAATPIVLNGKYTSSASNFRFSDGSYHEWIYQHWQRGISISPELKWERRLFLLNFHFGVGLPILYTRNMEKTSLFDIENEIETLYASYENEKGVFSLGSKAIIGLSTHSINNTRFLLQVEYSYFPNQTIEYEVPQEFSDAGILVSEPQYDVELDFKSINFWFGIIVGIR